MGQRNFSAHAESVAPDWFSQVMSGHEWKANDNHGKPEGIGEGFYVSADGLTAFAKPTAPPKPQWGPLHQTNTVACHEKIASDLAFRLQIAVPPALLWDCSSETGAKIKQRCVSLIPFAPFFTWKQILQMPGMVREIVPAISKETSEIIAFDTWLDNKDRVNSGNVILGMSVGSTIVRCAYIDFAQSMSFTWQQGPPPPAASSAPTFPGAVSLDLDAVEGTIAAIEALPEEEIKRIVERVPDAFTPPERKACIVQGLLLRRSTLRSVLLK